MKYYCKDLVYITCVFWVFNPDLLFAKILMLPKLDGHYSVGTKSIEVIDHARKAIRSSQDKKWMISAFYPTASHSDKFPYMPATIANGLVQGTKVLTHSKLNAKPITNHGKFPVVIFIPGRGELRQKYTILCENIAAQGYVILAMDQPYVASFVKFSDGTDQVLSFKDAWNLAKDRDYRYKYDDLVIKNAIEDIDYVLKHKDIVENIFDICDFNKVILMGHSLGGNVAHIMGFDDKRIASVVDIDSKITERQIYGEIGVPQNKTGIPILFIRGMMQYQEDVGDRLHKIKNATIWQPMVQHSAFSDNAYLTHYIDNFGTTGALQSFFNWFFKRGPHFDPIDTNIGKYDINSWYKEYCSYIIKWLKKLKIN